MSCRLLETPEADSQEALPCRSWAGLAPPFANRKAVQRISICPAHTLVLEMHAGDWAECLSSLTQTDRFTADSADTADVPIVTCSNDGNRHLAAIKNTSFLAFISELPTPTREQSSDL